MSIIPLLYLSELLEFIQSLNSELKRFTAAVALLNDSFNNDVIESIREKLATASSLGKMEPEPTLVKSNSDTIANSIKIVDFFKMMYQMFSDVAFNGKSHGEQLNQRILILNEYQLILLSFVLNK